MKQIPAFSGAATGFVVALIGWVAAVPALAHDDAIYLSINPMSCVPTVQTGAEQKFVKTAGRVKFRPDAVGIISFICPLGPIHSPNNREDRGSAKADALSLTMRYANRSFEGTITAAVRRAGLINGSVQNVLEVRSSPNTGIDNGGNSQFARASTSGGTLDFTEFTYWVQFTLKRDRVEMTTPDDVAGGRPTERGLAILDLGLKIAKIRH